MEEESREQQWHSARKKRNEWWGGGRSGRKNENKGEKSTPLLCQLANETVWWHLFTKKRRHGQCDVCVSKKETTTTTKLAKQKGSHSLHIYLCAEFIFWQFLVFPLVFHERVKSEGTNQKKAPDTHIMMYIFNRIAIFDWVPANYTINLLCTCKNWNDHVFVWKEMSATHCLPICANPLACSWCSRAD